MSWGYDWAGRLTSEVRTGSNAYSTAYTLDAGWQERVVRPVHGNDPEAADV